jgi:hypothetical protein
MMIDPSGQKNGAGEDKTAGDTGTGRRPRLLVRLIGLSLVIFSVFLATYLVVAYFAFETGRKEARQQATDSRNEQISRQIELAGQDLEEGNYRIALARLDFVLAEAPDNSRAQDLRRQVIAIEAAAAIPQPTPEPIEVVAGPDTSGDVADENPLPELQAIRRLTAAGQWEEALPPLIALRRQFPDYERRQTDELLYETYLNLGFEYVNTEKIELGLNYFSQAERLGTLPQEALDYRLWADLYLQGRAYFGVNYEIAGAYFRDLCAAAPFFQSSCARLYEALIGYGDQLAYNLDWCPAESVYREAWQQRATEALNAKLAQAREGCASATPVPLTDTLPITQTGSLTTTIPITPTESGD